jgi:hypothetical protein
MPGALVSEARSLTAFLGVFPCLDLLAFQAFKRSKSAFQTVTPDLTFQIFDYLYSFSDYFHCCSFVYYQICDNPGEEIPIHSAAPRPHKCGYGLEHTE